MAFRRAHAFTKYKTTKHNQSDDSDKNSEIRTDSRERTVVHYAVLEAIRAVYGIWQS